MPKFHAMLRVSGVEGADPADVQRVIEERMQKAGFGKWKILRIELEGDRALSRVRRVRSVRVPRRSSRREGWGIFLIAAAAWMVWFFWLLTD